MKKLSIASLALAALLVCAPAYGLDCFVNFGKAKLSAGISSGATSLTLVAGAGSVFSACAGQSFNATIWNSTEYADPSDDPSKEIVRVTNVAGDVLTITRGQEGTVAANHNIAGRIYRITSALTKKTLNTDIPAMSISGNAGTASALAGSPTQCAGVNFSQGIAANGNANCAQPSNVTGNAATASASDHLITSCGASTWANGLSTLWALACSQPAFSDMTGTATSGQVPLAATATALATDPSDCSANQFATAIAASGNLTCAQPSAANLSNGTSGSGGAVMLSTGPSATSLTLTGTAGAGFASYPSQSSNPAAPASGFVEFADSTGRKSWRRASDTFIRTWDATLTSNRLYTLPDADTKLPIFSQTLTFVGPSAGRTVTLPDADFTVARTDAANTFNGHQTIEGVTSTGATGTGKFVYDTSPTLGNATGKFGTGTTTGKYPGLYASFVSASGVCNAADTTDDALWTLTALPANTFTTNADSLVLTLSLSTGATANNKRWGLTVAGTQVNTTNITSNGVGFVLIATVTRVDATHVNVVVGGVGTTNGGKSLNLAVSDLTANTLAIVVTGASPTTGAASDACLVGGAVQLNKN